MDIYRINGGRKLEGKVKISGAKNAALPIIVASLLAEGETVIRNVPDLRDIRTMLKVIECLGAEYDFDTAAGTLRIRVGRITNAEVPYDLVKTMRASIYVMGPLLARIGEADVSMPGGCAIGERPVDIHLSGFEALGARVDLEHGYIKARANTLRGTEFTMRTVSVGATANIMMAAVRAEGTTVLENCAMELHGAVFQHRGSLRAHCRHHDVGGRAHGNRTHREFSPAQRIRSRLDVSMLEVHACSECFETGKVNVNRPLPYGAAAGHGNVGFADTGEERSHHVDRRPHGLDQVVGDFGVGDAADTDTERACRGIEIVFRAQAFNHLEHGAYIAKIRHVADDCFPLSEEARDDNGERGVFRAGDFHLAF